MILRVPNGALCFGHRVLTRHTNIGQHMIIESTELASAPSQTNGMEDRAPEPTEGRAAICEGGVTAQVRHVISFRDTNMGFIIFLDTARQNCIMKMNVFEANHHGL